MLSIIRLASVAAHSALSFGLVAAVLFGSLSGCKSGGSAKAQGRTTVTAGSVVYNTRGLTLGLISESMLKTLDVPGETAEERTVAFYSERRGNASIKVAPDDAIAGLSEYFDKEGFDGWSGPGNWSGEGSSALTVTIGDDARTMVQPSGAQADPTVLTKYIELGQAFQAVYNQVPAYQNLNQRPTFEKPVISEKLQAEIDTQLGIGAGN